MEEEFVSKLYKGLVDNYKIESIENNKGIKKIMFDKGLELTIAKNSNNENNPEQYEFVLSKLIDKKSKYVIKIINENKLFRDIYESIKSNNLYPRIYCDE